MKKMVAFILMVVAFLGNAGAQPIVGLGGLKIGMTEQEFLNLSEIKSKKIIEYSSEYKNIGEADVWKRTSKSPKPGYDNSTRIYLPDHTQYEFRMDIGLKDSTGNDDYRFAIVFYVGRLIHIYMGVENPSLDFKKTLVEKYGQPKISDYMKKVVCKDEFGASIEKDDGFITFEWGGEGAVNATYFLMSSKCGKSLWGNYTITNEIIFDYLKTAEKKAKNDEAVEAAKSKVSNSKL